MMPMTHFSIPDSGKSAQGLLHRLGHQIATFFGLADAPEIPLSMASRHVSRESIDTPAEPILRIVTVEPDVINASLAHKWRRHPQLRQQAGSDLASGERDARHEAVRGLFAARAGALECAASHFARAAQCHDIDLSAIPGFWQLGRSAMMTAVDAYEQAGRIRDASALNARIRTMYRPRALTPVPENVMHLPQTPSRASSGS